MGTLESSLVRCCLQGLLEVDILGLGFCRAFKPHKLERGYSSSKTVGGSACLVFVSWGQEKKGFQYLRGLTISFFTVRLSSFVYGISGSRHPPPLEQKLDQLSDTWRVLNCFWYSGIGWNATESGNQVIWLGITGNYQVM